MSEAKPLITPDLLAKKNDLLPSPVISRTKVNSSIVEAAVSKKEVIQAVAFYWVTSLAVVFLNKFIMSSGEFKFPYPLFVTWYQIIVALAILMVANKLGRFIPPLKVIPPFEFDWPVAKEILPLTFVYVGMLAFNNLCLRDVEVTFYQVARSLTILFQIFFTFVFLKVSTSFYAIISCLVVFVGFLIGSYGEVNFTWSGLFYGVMSSAFVALYGIYVKKKLQVVDNDQWRLLHYNTAWASILLLPFIYLFGESPGFYQSYLFLQPEFWLFMTFAGVTGFLINISIFLQIKVTSPLTNTISGTAKACVQTLLAWLVFQNQITQANGFGIFLSLFGSALYSYVRLKNL